MVTDQKGQRPAAGGRNGSARQPNGFEPQQTPAEHQTEIFARDVAAHLLQAHHLGRFARLQLFCSPEFLGVLRKVMHPQIECMIEEAVNKDYTPLSPRELLVKVKQQSGWQ